MKKGKFNKFITTNPWLKLISLVLAIVLWLFVVSKGRTVVIMDVPVGLRNMPAGLELVEGPETISVYVEGRERLLKKLGKGDIRFVIDLNDVKEGDNLFSVSDADIELPKVFAVKKILPGTIKLTVEEKAVKNVPVRPIIVGLPANGYVVGGIRVSPGKIRINGPKSVIAKVYSIKTEPIDITGTTESFRVSAALNISRENVMTDVSEVEVRITLGRAR
ncbi:MAG TPA: YbbR-like domain-containing protein [Nitrospirae bacterium]|nr:YbbR-like protein [bacterium BMS3Abin10]GBE39655.1 YbbR-like protein [bacterium BMS3Bbin08]HDK82066.1 YbbR-like domain-containing protein [Nitrospirota bacterium]